MTEFHFFILNGNLFIVLTTEAVAVLIICCIFVLLVNILLMLLFVVKVFALDISKQLEAYEVEYHVLQEEMSAVRGWKGRRHINSCSPSDTSEHLARLQIENEALHRQKTELLDQLQVTSSLMIIESYKMMHVIFLALFMAAVRSRCGHYIFALWFLSSIFFYSSPNVSGRRLDVYHTSTHGVALV